MAEDIRVGDTVWVAYPMPCCGSNASYGHLFVVKDILRLDEDVLTFCSDCGERYRHATLVCDHATNDTGFLLERLKKVPPLGELIGEDINLHKKVPAFP